MNFSEFNPNAKPTTNQSASSHLIVMGISYHNCPIFVRERFVIPESCIGHALGGLARMPHINEAAILSTCNRTEVYAVVSDVQAGMREIESFFLSAQTVSDHDVLKPNFRLLRDDVALHLFRVASGLDSMVLGEGQIMSQVKAAYKNALESGTSGPILGQLFQLALNCGKRVRTETSMGKRAVSVSSAAVELARDVLGPLKDRTTLIIGAGKMAQICAKHVMSESGSGPVIMINRTSERLEHFAGNKLPNKDRLRLGLAFEDRHQLAAAADLVIVATSAPKFLLDEQELKKHLQPGRKVNIVDISVPRNVEPSIGELDGIRLFDADNLVSVVNKNIAERESLIDEAEQIVMDVLLSFHEWERSLLVAPTITELRKKIEAIREEHLIKIERKQSPQEGRRDDFEDLSRALINQILHHPTTQLKSTSDYSSLKQQAEALRKLFNLDILATERCTTRGDKGSKRTKTTAEQNYAGSLLERKNSAELVSTVSSREGTVASTNPSDDKTALTAYTPDLTYLMGMAEPTTSRHPLDGTANADSQSHINTAATSNHSRTVEAATNTHAHTSAPATSNLTRTVEAATNTHAHTSAPATSRHSLDGTANADGQTHIGTAARSSHAHGSTASTSNHSRTVEAATNTHAHTSAQSTSNHAQAANPQSCPVNQSENSTNILSSMMGMAQKALTAIDQAKHAIGCPFHQGRSKSEQSSPKPDNSAHHSI